MPISLSAAISRYGLAVKAKLANPSASGEPEDQLRSPPEVLFADLAEIGDLPRADLALVGESAIASLKTRPDYAVTLRGVRVGVVEVKAPGKGADPRKYKGHDKDQWDKLRSLPNLLYTDGNAFSLWHSGEPEGAAVHLVGDVETAGAALDAPSKLVDLFQHFLHWDPIPPRTVSDLAAVSARLVLHPAGGRRGDGPAGR